MSVTRLVTKILSVSPKRLSPTKNPLEGAIVTSRSQDEPMMCIDAANPPTDFSPIDGHDPIAYPCHGLGSNQHFIFTKRNEIRFIAQKVDMCLSFGRKLRLTLQACSSSVQVNKA